MALHPTVGSIKFLSDIRTNRSEVVVPRRKSTNHAKWLE